MLDNLNNNKKKKPTWFNGDMIVIFHLFAEGNVLFPDMKADNTPFLSPAVYPQLASQETVLISISQNHPLIIKVTCVKKLNSSQNVMAVTV